MGDRKGVKEGKGKYGTGSEFKLKHIINKFNYYFMI